MIKPILLELLYLYLIIIIIELFLSIIVFRKTIIKMADSEIEYNSIHIKVIIIGLLLSCLMPILNLFSIVIFVYMVIKPIEIILTKDDKISVKIKENKGGK